MAPVNARIVLATGNEDKVKEIRKLLSGLNLTIEPLSSFPDAPKVIEDGKTLEENALKKAREISELTGLPAVADDTGLEVDALDGAPGVFSSRYSGENASYADNVRKLLRDLQGVPQDRRSARFRCVAAWYSPSEARTVEGVCEGAISAAPAGTAGFGYDPVFYVPAYDCTFAEMDLELKNRVSHRAKAFSALRALIKTGAIVVE